MPQRLQRAQTVIFLKFNRFGCLYRFIKRATKRHPNRPGMLTGAQEQITWEIIWYILYKAPKRQKAYTDILKNYPHLKVITIHDFNHLNALTENAMR